MPRKHRKHQRRTHTIPVVHLLITPRCGSNKEGRKGRIAQSVEQLTLKVGAKARKRTFEKVSKSGKPVTWQSRAKPVATPHTEGVETRRHPPKRKDDNVNVHGDEIVQTTNLAT